MNEGDTTLGGAGRAFPDTVAEFLSWIRDPSPDGRERGLEALCQRYWKPIYYYFRVGWAKSNEDAKDLTQAFLLWVAQGEALARYLPERASFRTYLKTLLKRFAQHDEEARSREKRGGDIQLLGLEEVDDSALPRRPGDNPETVFDRAWLRLLMERAVDRVRRRFKADGRENKIRIFEEYDLADPASRPTYGELADRLGLKEDDVRNSLFAVREQIRSEMFSEISTLTSSEDLKEEWNGLFGL